MLSLIYKAIFDSLSVNIVYAKLMTMGNLVYNNKNVFVDQSLVRDHPDINYLKDKIASTIISYPIGDGRFSTKLYSHDNFSTIREQFVFKESSIRELMNLSNEFTDTNKSNESNLCKLKFLWDNYDIAKIFSRVESGKTLFEEVFNCGDVNAQAIFNAFSYYTGLEYSSTTILIRALSSENECTNCDESKLILSKWIQQTLATYEDLFYYLYCAPWFKDFSNHPATNRSNFEYDNVFIVHAYDNNFGIKWGKNLYEKYPGILVHVKMPHYFSGLKFSNKYFIVTPQCSIGKHGFLYFENPDEREKVIAAVCDFFVNYIDSIDRLKYIISLKTKQTFTGNPRILSVIWNDINGSQLREHVDAKLSLRFLKELPIDIAICVVNENEYKSEHNLFAVAVVKQLLASFFIEALMRYFLQCLNFVETSIKPYLVV